MWGYSKNHFKLFPMLSYLTWGVTPILVKEEGKAKEIISKGIEFAKEKGYVKTGDIVAIAGGETILPGGRENIMNRTIGGVIRV